MRLASHREACPAPERKSTTCQRSWPNPNAPGSSCFGDANGNIDSTANAADVAARGELAGRTGTACGRWKLRRILDYARREGVSSTAGTAASFNLRESAMRRSGLRGDMFRPLRRMRSRVGVEDCRFAEARACIDEASSQEARTGASWGLAPS